MTNEYSLDQILCFNNPFISWSPWYPWPMLAEALQPDKPMLEWKNYTIAYEDRALIWNAWVKMKLNEMKLNENIANLHDDFGDAGFDCREIYRVDIDSEYFYVSWDKKRIQ